MIKKLCLLCGLSALAHGTHAQVLFTYGKKSVDASEFMRAYNRNKNDHEKQTSLQDYLDLYIRFKLKVEAAKELRMDTLQHIINDVNNFRNQVAANYLNDPAVMNSLKEEARQRAQKDLHIRMLSVTLDSAAQSTDSLNAVGMLNKAMAASKRSEKIEQPVRETDLGFITVFSLPYAAENLVYNLKPGEFSRPYRTKNALHIFRLESARPSIGKLKMAQILLAIPPDADAATLAALNKKADSVHRLLQGGLDFSTAAKTYSEDKLTYMTGGELPAFGTGEFDAEFERNALLLKNNGDISRPFTTRYGIHILKRISREPASDPLFMASVEEKLKRDARTKLHEALFLNSIRSKTGFALNKEVKEYDLLRYADTIMFRNELKPVDIPGSNKVVIRFKKGNATMADWLSFVREYKGNYDAYQGESNKQLLEKFYDVSLKEYYKKHLEEYNEDFAYQVKEFAEGNILFEIMEKKIWGFASSDSTGLQKLYESKRTGYLWPESADMIIMNASNEETAKETVVLLERNRDWKEITEAMQGAVQADSGRFEVSQIYTTTPKEGTVLPWIKNEDGSYTIIKVLKPYPAGEQKSFEDARGTLINDHQDALETVWVEGLKKKYPVKVNQKTFDALLQESRQAK